EPLGFHAHTGVIVNGRVRHGADKPPAAGEDLHRLAPVDALSRALGCELAVGGVHKNTDAGRRCGYFSMAVAVAVRAAAKEVALKVDEFSKLFVLRLELLQDRRHRLFGHGAIAGVAAEGPGGTGIVRLAGATAAAT